MGLQASDDGPGADDDADPPAAMSVDEIAHRGSEECRGPDAPNSKVLSSFIKNTYVSRARENHPYSGTGDLRLPKHFQELALGQQRDVLCHLQRLAPPQRQQVLDEWSARKVLKPVAYWFGLMPSKTSMSAEPGTESGFWPASSGMHQVHPQLCGSWRQAGTEIVVDQRGQG